MTRKKLLALLYLLPILLFLTCAKQTSPTGGPKDTIPPHLENSNPKQEATNFKGKTITLEFDEFINAANPNEQLIVTPSIGKDFKVKTKRNTVTIELEKSLLENTTYTFNFRESIQDITEKNPARNLQLAFSTGPYVDSLSITGKVTELIKAKEIKDAIVAINPVNDTFSILKHPATIFTRSDAKGNFTIGHLKPDIYTIYAFEDKNRNLVVDTRTEQYAFYTKPIILENDTANINLTMQKLDTRPLKISSTRPYNTYFNIRTTKNVKTYSLKSADTTKLYSSFGEDHSNIRIYNSISRTDSLAVNLSLTDSINNRIDTTLYIKFLTREVTPEKFNLNIRTASIIADKGLFQAELSFTKPVKQINFDSLFFQIDSTTTITFQPSDLTWQQTQNTAIIKKAVDKKLFASKPETAQAQPLTNNPQRNQPANNKTPKPPKAAITNQLFIGQATFISIDNDSSRRTTQTITPLKTEDLSKIIFSIRTNAKNIITQLLDKDMKVLQEIPDKTKAEFDDLPAGDYYVRVISDRNNNKAWDLGNYLVNQEPEPITYYRNEKGDMAIHLKANWELEINILLTTY